WHCANLYQQPSQQKFAKRLVANSFADTVFFCSTGAEAVETGIKMIRRHFHAKGEAKYRIITLEGAFHGRSFAGISASGHPNAVEGYSPLLDGFDKVPFNNLSALEQAITPSTAAVLLEPVQGEGGIRVLPSSYLRDVRAICDKKNILMFLDEVQCGMARTGNLFAHEASRIQPDLMAIAKGIGNGFPLAALLATENAASGMTPGSHGSTYGGNPLAMCAGNAVFDVLEDKAFLSQVKKNSAYIMERLKHLQNSYPQVIKEVRGVGLMLAIVMYDTVDYRKFAEELRHKGLLTAPAVAAQVIRLLPPLNVNASECDEAISLLDEACLKIQKISEKNS
ncbi:MAG: aspartate aminotransferase family protein, partial [Alphaproteobacteria bacterium]|nr:aspartate aminotransferase family protein [Alphaproteobacteria bacterium]